MITVISSFYVFHVSVVWLHWLYCTSKISNSEVALLFAMVLLKLQVILPFAEMVIRAQPRDAEYLLLQAAINSN